MKRKGPQKGKTIIKIHFFIESLAKKYKMSGSSWSGLDLWCHAARCINIKDASGRSRLLQNWYNFRQLEKAKSAGNKAWGKDKIIVPCRSLSTMNVEIFVLKCQKCNECLNVHKSLKFLFSLSFSQSALCSLFHQTRLWVLDHLTVIMI